jgi:hypothetical protein
MEIKMGVIEPVKQAYRSWSERRFLKKHHCENWEQYNRKFDPDVYNTASRIVDYYSGYNHIYCFENYQHEVYYWDLGIDGVYIVNKWCKENLKGKYRFDFHRVVRAPSTSNEWEINEIGGGDHIFFACKNEQDYMMFLLKWS